MISHRAGAVVSIGECMVELARGADGRYALAVGGDTFNTAVYLARAGVPVAYASALGDDPYSRSILALAGEEGVATDLVAVMGGRNAGLYLIETAASGERSFWYWRERAPARELFEDSVGADHRARVEEACCRASHVYLSGITLSIYSQTALDRLAGCLAAARAAGAVIVMDGNYRPRNFGGDRERARRVLARFWRLSDVALPSFDDEAALWGDLDPGASASRIGSLGPREIVVKNGAGGAVVSDGSELRLVPCPEATAAIDTTAAGDSFNAGYLAARRRGLSPFGAALEGHRLAAVVIGHRGAIVPREATGAVLTLP